MTKAYRGKEGEEDRCLQMGGIEVEIHLAFPDDVVLFCRANAKLMLAIGGILQEFKEFSGLEINDSKSLVIFSKFGT